ncbi:MAG: hypothetical protein BZ138_03650 [Methanosphaera sp. rholeuAM270]|nr:MAG: hypothetical protein BZ138_03650 [Methanosphaera sp. rholeuAM270]
MKETENTRIEKDSDTVDEIEMLYSFGVVLFEHVLLESDNVEYSICYFAPQEVYDIVIEDKENNSVSYNQEKELTANQEKLFSLIKNETVILDDEEFICKSHSIEHTL